MLISLGNIAETTNLKMPVLARVSFFSFHLLAFLNSSTLYNLSVLPYS